MMEAGSGSGHQTSPNVGGLVSIVSYNRPSLMMIVKTDCETDGSSAALLLTPHNETILRSTSADLICSNFIKTRKLQKSRVRCCGLLLLLLLLLCTSLP